jgi:hypothetical protein
MVGTTLHDSEGIAASFLAGPTDDNIYVWDDNLNNSDQDTDCPGTVFCTSPDGSTYNYQSIAIGGNPTQLGEYRMVGVTRNGNVSCYNLSDLGNPQLTWARDLSADELLSSSCCRYSMTTRKAT